jgi:hypothetical protein
MPHLPVKQTRLFHHFEEAVTKQNNFCIQCSIGFNAYPNPIFIYALREALAFNAYPDLVFIFALSATLVLTLPYILSSFLQSAEHWL